MNMITRPLTLSEVSEIMHRLGWEVKFHSGDDTMLTFGKQVDDLFLNCRLELQAEGKWLHSFMYLPGVQMLVQISTSPAAFPHPKFSHWERRMFDYAHACEAVARTH